ncbi:MAG: DNA polymerase III subunit alpha [Flavobacteriales bacterium CG_4_10_14_0_2_um_filter_32_8]|nr:MAG: DNA polymerase III subunit alpha [Flavobacteriales bacterium CG_4_10_14_0_2_um_filter_32_8]PJB13830.1 MAG: DNA polymerase III subunit alpha [Flavobacteriales bacterium CG_4_9_14_3_um_filter_32_8]
MFLIFDTETTGLPNNYKAPISDSNNWPRMVQLAWQLHDSFGRLLAAKNYIVKPEGYEIPIGVSKIHGITTERALRDGVELKTVLEEFKSDLEKTTYNVGHNIEFDINVVGAEYYRLGIANDIASKKGIDTMKTSVNFCELPGGRGGGFKYPKLTDLHIKLFGESFEDAHDAAYDVAATARCFFGLISSKVIQLKEITNANELVYEAPILANTNFKDKKVDEIEVTNVKTISDTTSVISNQLIDVPFVHLHNHSQFSILQSTTDITSLINKAHEMGMEAVALTDHGNMMATFHFVRDAIKKGIKPIVGCEFFVCHDRKDKSYQDNGFQTVILAKNKNGYQNLIKLASYANIDGFYYVPRIDKELLLQYKEDLIILTGGIWGEIPNKILFEGEKQAEEALLWWAANFGEDFYIEINRHGIEEENEINKTLLSFAKKHHIKYIAANNTYYLNKSDAEAHDVLLCIRDAKPISQPKRYIGKGGREFRFGFPNDEFYFKSADEMKRLFADLPEAIINTKEIVDKIESFKLSREVLLPKFDIPDDFKDDADLEDDSLNVGENNYLRHLTYEGAKIRYQELTDKIIERIDFELDVIRKTGYPGYFLIVEDFIREARKMGVSVGPGRGSAAGSVVAYCTKITNIDPLKYDLLFERFLNPDRISMPDIDIDFDDEGRQKVIDYVIHKYGSNQVAQIITYGTMAAKSSIRDTARVLEFPLNEAGKLAGLIPNIELNKIFNLSEADLKLKLPKAEDFERAKELKDIAKGENLAAKTVNHALMVEGSMRNTGIHACGIIITPDDITNYVPVALAKDSEMACTQFDNSVAEDAGLLKMDFLGLKTLTLIKDAIQIIKNKHGIELDPESFDIEDEETYLLFQRGDTIGIFQYESPGMQKHLRHLKPSVFADLIAMNALYRPGPMEYIPSFIKRKHGEEKVEYDVPDMEEYLKETYGITVYQEQVMLLSQKLANFTKGEADVLRKAMGKKQIAVLDKMKPKFIEQAKEKGHPEEKLEKIWKDWEAFAAYAFNKSHSTCYAWIGFQTAYLKAHYPAEYMASVLSNNMSDISKVTFFMDECKRMGVQVLGPDINESVHKFTVNSKGQVRFGLGALKGVGEKAVESIIAERSLNGPFKSIFDVTKRIDLRAANKKTLESLTLGGGFDSFPNIHRAQYFNEQDGITFLEKAIKYGNKFQDNKNSSQVSIFDAIEEEAIDEPKLPECDEWTTLEKLNHEKEIVGIFISGHPLDDFALEIKNFGKGNLSLLTDLISLKGKELALATICTGVQDKMTKTGKPYGILTVEDYQASHEFFVFSEEYIKLKPYFIQGQYLFITGSVQPKKWSKDIDDIEFKISSIELLAELRDKKVKTLTVNMETKDITEELIEKIYTLLDQHQGKCEFSIQIKDEEEGIIRLSSRSKRINISDQFLQNINEIKEITYQLY